MSSSPYELKPNVSIRVVRAGEGGQYTSDFEEGGFVSIGYYPVGNSDGMDRKTITEWIVRRAGLV
jgi:hypothetical protein